MRRGLTSPSGLAHYKVRQSGGSTMMKTKALLLGAAIATHLGLNVLHFVFFTYPMLMP